MKSAVIVQMRLDSKRLPKKALLPFADSVLADYVLKRLKKLQADCYILATCEDASKELSPYAKANGYRVFIGPKEDVLARYALAIEEYGLDIVIRATGDNPFVSIPLAELAFSKIQNADYVGLKGMPIGMGVEVVKAQALLDATAKATEPYDREHVCPYLYKRPEQYKILQPDCPEAYYFPDARLTIDSLEDYKRAIKLIENIGPNCDDSSILAYLHKEASSLMH